MTTIRRLAPARSLASALSDGDSQTAGLHRYDRALRYSGVHGAGAPTPSINDTLPFRRGGFGSLCEALDYAAQGDTGLNFFDARGKLLRALPYRHLRAEAGAFARHLIGGGFARGDRLMLIADTWPGFVIAFFGAQYAGVVPVPVSVPVGLGARAAYIDQLRGQIEASGAAGILAPDDLADFAQAAAKGSTVRIAGSMAAFRALPEDHAAQQPFAAGDRCYIQFSSGSTRMPRGVDIRQNQLMANIDGSLAAQELNETDSGVSWLPLYHDMGLIGFVLAPMCAQRSVDLLSPGDFARRPLQWLSLISRRRATVTYSPSFGYDLVVRRAQTKPIDGIDLSSLRLAGIGADMIQPTVLDRFAATFASAGFDRRALFPSYGMAELCVGLSFVRPFRGFRTDSFPDPVSGQARDFVVCGHVMTKHRVEIRDPAGLVVGQRQIGRLFVHGPSVMPGYFPDDPDSARTLCNGWLDTGDLGYWTGDEIVVTGRAKDLIIVNGRNIWPQDIEWRIEELPQLRRGDACAFSVDAAEGEALVVIVQSSSVDAAERGLLEDDIRQAVKEGSGIDGRIVLISRRPGLPVTSSGKLSRAAAKAVYLAGAYDDSRNETKTI
ncbi:MAG: fatty acyl-AMP ligase [Proteobacteria bacterium]|nr:fatty acyl-AMP ligase [Pseudomonadota bacterium]